VKLRFVVVQGVLHWSFSLLLAYNFHIHPANEKQAQIAEEIYQAVLSNRKPEHADKVHSANLVSHYRKKYIKWSPANISLPRPKNEI
jgi:hypothetical protein